jgi:ribosome-binding protein aMBF1 (putative translation factor)
MHKDTCAFCGDPIPAGQGTTIEVVPPQTVCDECAREMGLD